MGDFILIEIIFAMFLIGILLGFIGAGGSGFMLAILTIGFDYPIHIAMGTALAAMMFSSLAGAISQFRSGNTDIISGLVVGSTGAIASWFGTKVALLIHESVITWLTAGMLTLSSIALLLLLTSIPVRSVQTNKKGVRFIISAIGVGLITGFLSGTFGIGSTPFIQIGLVLVLGLSLRVAVGTSMIIILPIAAAGGAGYFWIGSLDMQLFISVLIGSMAGSYLGAKFTNKVPNFLLKLCMIITPFASACLLFYNLLN